MAGPAFRGGVKFVKFYVFGGFLQPAAEIDPVQGALPPVSDPSLGRQEAQDEKNEKRYHDEETEGEGALLSLYRIQ